MTQFSLKAGLKQWGDKVHSSTRSEMNQLHIRKTFITTHRRDMTYEEHQMVLDFHMFLKHNLDGKIKVGTVDGCKKQRTYIARYSAQIGSA